MRPPRSLLPYVVAAVALLGAIVVPAGTTAPPAGAFPGPNVELDGHGFGHGRGLSQFGSLGYAVNHGWSYQQILDHYYGGTSLGNQADGVITVRLTALDGGDMIVTSGAPFNVGGTPFGPGTYARVERAGSGQFVLHTGPGCAGPWTLLGPAGDPVARTDADPGDDIGRMLTVCTASATRAYRGALRMLFADGATRTVNEVTMEHYLRGVVPRESPASWADLGGGRGAEALKAQAVAARSYAWAEGRHTWAKTCDTTSCQVYGGAGLNGVRIEDARSDAAVSATSTQVRRHTGSGAIARTEFSSSSGGFTAGGTFPAVVDEGDAVASNPNHTWQASIPVSRVESRYPQIGSLFSVDVTRRNGLGDFGGRALTVVVRGGSGSVTLTGNEFRSAFGLKSDWYRVRNVVLNQPAVGLTNAGGSAGYWIVARDGGIFSFDGARFFGSMGGTRLNQPMVGMTSTRSGNGYWTVASDGGIFSFGDAGFFGSTGAIRLNQPVVGMAATPSGNGYWLVAADGGIFSFGDARFFGSTGAIRLNRPIVGMAAHPSGSGYWFVATDGGVFSFGAATFHGSTGDQRLASPIVGMAATPSGNGYRFAAADGGVFDFGDA